MEEDDKYKDSKFLIDILKDKENANKTENKQSKNFFEDKKKEEEEKDKKIKQFSEIIR